MRVATYSRVSTADKGQNPEVQTHELRRYCEARGWTIVHELVDHGHSGSTSNRPALKELMALVHSRKVDAVIVVKLDRLFRSLKHLVTSLDEFHALGVTFVAVRDSLDYSTPSGRLMAQILGSLAEFEKSLLVERTKMGIAHARATGIRLGRPRLNQETEVLKLRKLGHTYRSIAKKLGISRGSVQRALQSPILKTPGIA